jgi:dynein heavy chain
VWQGSDLFYPVALLQEGKVYTFEELSDSSAALISQRHAEMRDAGKEIGKLLSSSNRVLKVGPHSF